MINFFKSFLPFILFFLIQLAVTIPMMVIQVIIHFLFSDTPADTGVNFISYTLSLLQDTAFLQRLSVVFSITIIIIFGIWYRKVFVTPFRKKKKRYWSGFSVHIFFALIFLAFGLQYITVLLTSGISWIRPEWMVTYNQTLYSAGFDAISILLAIYTIILAPIGEEIAFRGLTYRFARKALPFWGANILQAALFGLMHMNVVQGIYSFFLGLILGWLCRTGRSIKYAVILHMLYNLLGSIFSGFFDLTTAFSFAGFSAIGIALTIFALYIYNSEFQIQNDRFVKE
ncbi:CAAX amino terminal protease self-immunity [uncultured Roseburia sp.]|uniref:CPBP family intramembrane metalloprotease n=1 Tax=Brotonthovivens ammoniilytica TaxID=2981725 RepID=A0ABT2TK11_9FIRM|nr:CPBP family intramembrane glutamic endopeptidase [Brotonthovivens ammoniilytica]MCU6762560.1 CPBP family intramembrane metalloprotease [Brotonthovivens ammoniilytica]SCI75664.1 CAAX amino terminal protease self-immunity [uncultured Roseburia sp.]